MRWFPWFWHHDDFSDFHNFGTYLSRKAAFIIFVNFMIYFLGYYLMNSLKMISMPGAFFRAYIKLNFFHNFYGCSGFYLFVLLYGILFGAVGQ